MSPTSQPTRAQLQEYLWDKSAVPEQWMFTYLDRRQLLNIYKAVRNAPEGKIVRISPNDVAKLEAKRLVHREKTRTIRRDRKEKYGIGVLTARETLKHLSRLHPTMEYVETRNYDSPFTSETGAARSKQALVFKTDLGMELLFTATEAKTLQSFGVEVPASALRAGGGKSSKRGLGGLL